MQSVIYRRIGVYRPEVILGPRFGADSAVVGVSRRKVLLSTSDPLSFIPSIGPGESAWLSVHLIASDLSTSGFSPQYAIIDLNLPPAMKESALLKYWDSFHNECRALGVAILGGHTGRYDGCDYTIIGGGVMMALCPANLYLTSDMAREGDELILTKGAAIESTAVLTRSFPRKVRKALGPRLFEHAWNYLKKVSTVDDALTAASVGVRASGVTAMHDATEGGVLAGLMEIAIASRLGLRLDLRAVPIAGETAELCKFFRIDPMTSLSEGSLIIAARPFATSRVIKKLSSHGLTASVVGGLVSEKKGMRATTGKTELRLKYPARDPYWEAYSRATEKGWN